MYLMSSHPGTKFKKAKLPQILVYKEIETKRKKNTPNLRIAKLDQIEKNGAKLALQTKWDYKIQNLTLQRGVNMCLIYTSTVTHSDSIPLFFYIFVHKLLF